MFPLAPRGRCSAALVLAATACAPPAASAQPKPGVAPAAVAPTGQGPAVAAIAIPGAPSVGALEWRFNAGSSIPAAPAVGADGTVYVGTGDGAVQAIAADGALRWSYTVEGAVLASPLVDSEGRVLIATSAARLYAFWPSGERAWALRLRAHVATELVPAATLGGVLVGTADGSLWALSERGSPLWHTDAGGPLSSVLGVSGRRIVAATQAGDALLFEGAVRRSRAVLGAAPREGAVVFEDGSAALLAGSSLLCVNTAGAVAWRREDVAWLGGASSSLLAIEKERGGAHTVLSHLGADGRVLSSARLPGSASGPPISGENGVVYVSGDAGELWAVARGGAVSRSRIARTALHRPVLDAPRRRVVVAAGSGAITVVELAR
jgi:outer membrane protein assembly factor BamB